MKNYLITLNDYEIVQRRLNRLYENKTRFQEQICKVTGVIKEVLVSGGVPSDKMTEYVSKIEEIDLEINELKQDSDKLKEDLDYMQERLSNIRDIKEQIFVMYFIKGMEVRNIAYRIPCDQSTVYRYIRQINKEKAKLAKKYQKSVL